MAPNGTCLLTFTFTFAYQIKHKILLCDWLELLVINYNNKYDARSCDCLPSFDLFVFIYLLEARKCVKHFYDG